MAEVLAAPKDVTESSGASPEPAAPVAAAVEPKDDAAEGRGAAPEPAAAPLSDRDRRAAIRARLRASEDRLKSLVRSTSGDGSESVINQMRSVRQSLTQVEKKKDELEEELNRLKNATDGDDFLKEKMAGIQEGFQKQVKKIQSLEDELLSRNSEIEHLRDELRKKIIRIVELEFDLETHSIHYTSYAAEQFKLGEEALVEIRTPKGEQYNGNDSNSSLGSSERSGSKKRMTPRKAQKLISKLLSDLDSLEERYKELKLNSETNAKQMEIGNGELLTKIQVLESRLAEQDKDEKTSRDDASTDTIDTMDTIFNLRRQVETLEAKRTLYRNEMSRLKGEVKEARKEADSDAKKANNEIERLSLENDTMRSRIRGFESGDITAEKEEYSDLETRIRANYAEISNLEASNEIKDRQLATLKKEINSLRLKGGQKFSEFDSEILSNVNTSKAYDDASGLTASTASASQMSEMQAQLREAQQQLVKKDQELVIERAKAASTAAGLLARITELSEKKDTPGTRAQAKSAATEKQEKTESQEKKKEAKGEDEPQGKKKKKKRGMKFYL